MLVNYEFGHLDMKVKEELMDTDPEAQLLKACLTWIPLLPAFTVFAR